MKKLFLFVIFAFFMSFIYVYSERITSDMLGGTNGISGISVYNIHKDEDGILWFGTDSGIGKYDGCHLTHYSLSDTVFAVRRLVDAGNNLLGVLGADGKILFFDLKQGKTVPVEYDSDGLSEKVWADLCRTGENGLCALYKRNLFHLEMKRVNDKIILRYDSIRAKSAAPPRCFVLSRIMINNRTVKRGEKYNGQVVLSQPVHTLRKLTLEHANKHFTLFPADLRYDWMGRKMFYRLLPDTNEWSVLNVREGLTFPDLSVGEHTLQVQPVAEDGTKGEMEEFTICILPHWSVAWWAWSIYCVIFAFIIYAIMRFIRRRVKSYKQKYQEEEKLKNKLYFAELKHKQEQESLRVKNKFYGFLTNELRTPLTMIINPLREILNTTALPGTLKKQMEVAYFNSIGLKDICTQLTNMYSMETDYECLQVGKWDLFDILENIIREQQENLNAYHIDFRYVLPQKGMMEIWADRDMLEFVIRILLSNAYRHVIYAGGVELKVCRETENGKEFWIISVSDNGREKVEEDVENFLQQISPEEVAINFSRLELGFDLLEKIVYQHHGKINFKSEEEAGTQVSVKLRTGADHFTGDSKVVFVQNASDPEPVNDSLSLPEMDLWGTDEDETSFAAAKDRKKKLLVVEDDQTFRMYMRMTFAAEYEVLEAENGQAGIDTALKELPDVILCDVMMPVKSGFDCCRELKGNLRTCHIPIIFLTAKGMENDIMNGVEMGADDYLHKPVNIDILRVKVAAIIKNRENLKKTYMKQLMTTRTDEEEDKEALPVAEDPFIKKLVGQIEAHMLEVDFSVTALAKLMNMSQPTLYRKVKQSTDFNIVEFIRGVRLRKAAELLEQTDYSIQEVIEKVGYNDQASFRRHFMKLFKMTPSAYIKEHKSEF